MDALRILITGASGAGTTTLGRALAQQLDCTFFDADDYYWLPSNPPFQHKQEPAIRACRLLRDLREVSVAVIAGSIMKWSSELEDSLSLIVFLTVPARIRVPRLREREMRRFGRVDPTFLAWAAQYDEGKLEGRSLAKHETWLSRCNCPVLRIEGDTSTESSLARVREMMSLFPREVGGLPAQ